MSFLFEEFMEPCLMLDRRSESTPAGPIYRYEEGAEFRAAIILDQSLAARVAEKEGVTQVYTVYAEPSVNLDFHDVFRRKSDGQTFRVTTATADSRTPGAASFKFVKTAAERWEIPE